MQSYREAAVLLSVQWLLAPDHPCLVINLKQVLGLLVNPLSL